ncbi:hypothetical protein RN001_012867 [Aquatica leii]|uniref:Uncharacterized protein n=1 Tax=Aquatica leii TaxID=1421715 RepID=A0AAN7NYZ4_9COLE|nr:hypothetical protein RN001_012867 [Aquatica leii]
MNTTLQTERMSPSARFAWNMSLSGLSSISIIFCSITEVFAEDVKEWIMCNSSNSGFQIVNDDKLIESVREETDAEPLASEAFASLEIALKWMKRQPECDHTQLLTGKRMRDLTARKRIKTAK